jgi:hypothetical protein
LNATWYASLVPEMLPTRAAFGTGVDRSVEAAQ